MSVERIRTEHLVHLVKLLEIPEDEKSELQSQAESMRPETRLAVLDRLEAERPGTKEHLLRIWTAYSRQALFLWHLPALNVGNGAVGVQHLVADAVARVSGKKIRAAQLTRDWFRIDYPPKEMEDSSARVLRVRWTGSELGATVRLTKVHHYVYEDQEQEQQITSDVNLAIDLSSEKMFTKVFSGQGDAQKAVRTFVEWITGAEVPRRGVGRERFLKPFNFKESDVVRRLAPKLGLVNVGIHGADPRGIVGEVAFIGKHEGEELEALDLSDQLVKACNAAPRDMRTYNYTFVHPQDGYTEKTRVTFSFKGRQSHLSLLQRTSQSAVEHLIQALYAEVSP